MASQACAAVCKGWQVVIESQTFETLTVDSSSIEKFGEIFIGSVRRQACLKNLIFTILLEKTVSSNITRRFSKSAASGQNSKFTYDVLMLFGILCLWDADEIFRINKSGLSLEIAVDYRKNEKYDDSIQIEGVWGFRKLSWCFRNATYLPEIEIITDFRILRRVLGDIDEAARLKIMHLSSWPTSLRKISIFQPTNLETERGNTDSSSEYDSDDVDRDPTINDRIWTLQWDISADMALRCRRLEGLGICNTIEATTFFNFLQPPPTQPMYSRTLSPGVQPMRSWDTLRFLSLTASMISPQKICDPNGLKGLNNLLARVARLAVEMRAMKALELFNASNTDAAIFRLLVTQQRATIHWIGTWSFSMDEDVKRLWECTTIGDGTSPEFAPEGIVAEYNDPTNFIVTHLLTRGIIFHPSTIMDITGTKEFRDPLVELGLKSPYPEYITDSTREKA
ncbi:uncharacterized protein F4822DRAFT_442762 [Hypoxylon trugodes]|uniref:uncharacterized protein n=1 Tax=Hypoxylon trugodes TaxID=326681 RepID=UPI00219EC52B|nr:uncharacterized protein F4822DRAFT_442762 [Hypoxylon trugodes]KAI1389485.1 hypothetical protein F4822DRAFT_442762 [Hypoxylon trugodes]